MIAIQVYGQPYIPTEVTVAPVWYKCTKHQFIHLLTATCNVWHIENSKNQKKGDIIQQHIDS